MLIVGDNTNSKRHYFSITNKNNNKKLCTTVDFIGRRQDAIVKVARYIENICVITSHVAKSKFLKRS